MTVEIPNKSSFKVNEVCALTDVKSYVLRFWESEFPEISPLISSSGQKIYDHRNIEIILTIKKLLFENKLTIEEAKGQLKLLVKSDQFVTENYEEGTEGQYLSMAKNKLKHILLLTETLQSKYNW
jgi:DNA-binding transcriptional MerR regulator